VPENLPPAEDVKKLERKLNADERKLVSDVKKKRSK
jgi:DNA-damage-inducible protein D